MIRVGIVGYGTIGQRLANAVSRQRDMRLIGVVDIKPTQSILALRDLGMPFDLYLSSDEHHEEFNRLKIPISGMLTDFLYQCDIILDATPAGQGTINKKNYIKYGKKAVFQGGEVNSVADILFHGYANYDKGYGSEFLKISYYNINGLTRIIDCLDRAYIIKNVSIVITECNAEMAKCQDQVTLNKMCKKMGHQIARDIMQILPNLTATCKYEYTENPGNQAVMISMVGLKEFSKEFALITLKAHDRILVKRKSISDYINLSQESSRPIYSNQDDDIYRIVVWEDSVVESRNKIFLEASIPRESIIIPETIDAIRASCKLQPDSITATTKTNEYLRLRKQKSSSGFL